MKMEDTIISKDIHSLVSEKMFSNSNVVREQGGFEKILNDRTVASWGWTAPYLHNGQRVVYLVFSPEKKGDKQLVIYDFISDVEYRKTN